MARRKIILVIVEGPSDDTALSVLLDKLFDKDNGIHTKDVSGIVERNRQKRENIYRLKSNGKIWNIPYRVYYMSCNLDHVLYDKRNSTDEDKESDAYVFAKRYKGDINGFVEFICESEFSVKGDFRTSWEFMEKEMNSMNRFTNLCIWLKEEQMELL